MPLLSLTQEERTALERARDTAQKPFQRTRAAALLKIADGLSVSWIARQGLLRPHKRTTLYTWVRRYRAEGIDALSIREGRGRKPAFSPSLPGSPGGQAAPPERPASRSPLPGD